MKQKNQKKTLLIVVIALVVSIVGVSFAYYMAVLRGENVNKISTAKTTIVYTESNQASEQARITYDYKGVESYDYYEFTISSSTEGDSAVGYAIYLEEEEGNTLDKSLIHYYLSDEKNDPIDYDNSIDNIFGEKILYCKDYSTDSWMDGTKYSGCDSSLTMKSIPLATAKEEYPNLDDPSIQAVWYKDAYTSTYYTQDIEVTCDRTIMVDKGNGPEAYGKGPGQGEDCRYGEVAQVIKAALPLLGRVNNNDYLGKIMSNRNGKYDDRDNAYGGVAHDAKIGNFDNLIYVGRLGTNRTHDETYYNDSKTFRLRYWISAEEIAKREGYSEATNNLDGSVSAEIGEDATFKFKIGVYAKTASPS